MQRRRLALALTILATGCTRTVYVTQVSPSPSPVVVTPTATAPLSDQQPPFGQWWCFLSSGNLMSCGNDQMLTSNIPLGPGGVLYTMGPCSYQDLDRYRVGLPGKGTVTIWSCSATVQGAG
jgi:hypothetical protein